jgi:hypothetical protein
MRMDSGGFRKGQVTASEATLSEVQGKPSRRTLQAVREKDVRYKFLLNLARELLSLTSP